MSNSVKGPYKLIDRREFTADTVFEPQPISLVLIAGLEVVVRDAYGDYLLVTNPQYEPVETDETKPSKVEDSFWTVPYVTKTIHPPEDSFRNVFPTIEIVDKAVASWKPRAKLKAYARTFSIGVTDLKLIDAFCELKRSWSQPHITVLYHIMRYSLVLGNLQQRNLADAESRKGYTFIPIDKRYEKVVERRACPVHKRDEVLYLAQPLASNLAVVLEKEESRNEMSARAMTLAGEHFSRDYTGLLFCGDISGYGAASAYAEAHMGGFEEIDHGAVLRDSATIAFTDLFMEAGIAQVHTAGDGFICALPLPPLDRASEARAELKRFAKAYKTYLACLDRLGRRIAEHFAKNHTAKGQPPVMGSRLAIHYGEYRFGKMSQAASLLTSFDGRQIVAVSRLEQGLRSVAKDDAQAKKHRIAGARHIAAASMDVIELLRGGSAQPAPILSGFEELKPFTPESKEYKGKAVLMRELQPK